MAGIAVGQDEVVRTTAAAVRRFRARRHQLHLDAGSVDAADVDLLDLGVQDTGADGSAWALVVRGARLDGADLGPDLFLAWTWRVAPHAYRRADAAAVAVATAPYDEVDAAKRIFDSAKPLKAAGLPVLDALAEVARLERRLVRKPMVKGELSALVTEATEEPFHRWCRPCQATHLYEQVFRLPTLQGGLELEPGTSPPVLRRMPGVKPNELRRLAGDADPRHEPIRTILRFFGPASVKDVAGFLDAPPKVVTAHWPDDVVEAEVADAPLGSDRRWILGADVDDLEAAAHPGDADDAVRLLGPYDPYLQGRDRPVLVADDERRRALWPVLGRPGAVVRGGELVALWRPRTRSGRLTVVVEPWARWTKALAGQVEEQAARLAAHRGVALAGVERATPS